VIALLLLALGRQSDISLDLEQALAGKKLAGPTFHQAIDPVLDKYGALKSAQFQRTVGDKRGMICTVTGSGANWDSTKLWRVLLWPEGTKIRAQVIKRFGDYSTSAIDSYTDGEIYWRNDRLVIAGKEIDGTPTSRAGLTSYSYEGAHWKLDQHLTSERQGVAVFARLDQAIDPTVVMVRTRLRPDHFRVKSDGPMLTFKETWLLRGSSYVKGKPQQEDTAVAFLDKLVGLVLKKDRHGFETLVAKPYREVLWKFLADPKLSISRHATDDDGSELFHIGDMALIVGIFKVGNTWTVSKVIQS
jgi:hypothetical protein